MRARLYLNGDGNGRQTHMSLFFVLMRGSYDNILKFPFDYKIIFCLYDQVLQRDHFIDSFGPGIQSSSFGKPQSDMNIPIGIPKFFRLAMIQQEGNPYVRDDTMFIKIMVDFRDMPQDLIPYAISLNPGLPTKIRETFIDQKLCEEAIEEQRQRFELRTNDRQSHETTDDADRETEFSQQPNECR